MKALLPTPQDLNLEQIFAHFDTEQKARDYLEAVRWPLGVVCPHCQNKKEKSIWRIQPNKQKKIREGLYQCGACKGQFSVTVGTIFEDSHIPLRKWLVAWYLLCSSKKGIAALQIQRQLGLGSYRTALFMLHRIRFALKDPMFSGKMKGTVEVDETYVGGKRHNVGQGYRGNKTPVVALVERDGQVRSMVPNNVTAKNVKAIINEHVMKSATIMTDESPIYTPVGREYAAHKSVQHGAYEYVRGETHTNTVEGYFSLLKRGIIGTFHSVSKKHLPLYLAEFNHRYNLRSVTDGERTIAGLMKAEGKRLTYKPLAGSKQSA